MPGAYAGEYSYGTMMECDPGDTANPGYTGHRPLGVYNTPIPVQDQNTPKNKVLPYFEHTLNGSPDEGNYYFARYYDSGGSRTCEVKTSDDLGLVTPYNAGDPPANAKEMTSGSPVLLAGASRYLQWTTTTGWVIRYELGADGLPNAGANDYAWDTTTGSPGSEGPDSSAFVDPNADVMLWGNKCSNSQDCTGDWGDLTVVYPSVEDTVQDTLGLESWTFSSPVGLSDTAGSGSDELLVAFGTIESVDYDTGGTTWDFNSANDCELITVLWDPTGETMSIADRLDGGTGDCGTNNSADGYGGEPVPYNTDDLFVLRRYGQFRSASWTASDGSLTENYTVTFKNASGDVFLHPNEMSPVYGENPVDGATYMMWGVNRSTKDVFEAGNTFKSSIYVAIPPDDFCGVGVTSCDEDLGTSSYIVDEIDAISGDEGRNPAWAPGAAATYSDGTTDRLAFVVAVGAVVRGSRDNVPEASGQAACDETEGEVAPRLHVYHLVSGTWEDDWVDLGSNCYELVDGEWDSIDIVSGVVVRGPAADVATSDGTFWEFDTLGGGGGGQKERLVGYSGDWPRFRDVQARARAY